MTNMHERFVMLRPFLVVAGISITLVLLYAVRENREDIESTTRFRMWVRCALEAALVLFYLYRVPYVVRVSRYNLRHEPLLYNVQSMVGTALAFGVVALAAWDCRRVWRRLERTITIDSAK